MLRKLSVLFAVGVLPLVVGVLLHFLVTFIPITGSLRILFDLTLLVLWGYLAYKFASSDVNFVLQAVVLSLFGLVVLALLLYQELVLGYYWPNIIGIGTQAFFLPWLSLSSAIVVPFFGSATITFVPIYAVAWCVMFASCCIGCGLKCRMHK